VSGCNITFAINFSLWHFARIELNSVGLSDIVGIWLFFPQY